MESPNDPSCAAAGAVYTQVECLGMYADWAANATRLEQSGYTSEYGVPIHWPDSYCGRDPGQA